MTVSLETSTSSERTIYVTTGDIYINVFSALAVISGALAVVISEIVFYQDKHKHTVLEFFEHYLVQLFTIFSISLVIGAMKYLSKLHQNENKYEESNAKLIERIDHSNERLMERLNIFVGGLVQEQGRNIVSLTKGMEARMDAMEERQDARMDAMEERQDARHTEMMTVLNIIATSLKENKKSGFF